ncbi:type II toxin-antitoxin system Phd/YefM family antitoxin [Lactococcus insecticola]|uniref:Antitoxin n=1 Tax=Pseudolactococcus insecticola TaxID=2709158 RepID=A0A6A0B3R1_9LACT|nr:type II toxin-antitoxin system prevent-host-death family antitoxin [Lactococcus insecticola]GFH39960.1 antitoxin [Lactococcus insecticola]
MEAVAYSNFRANLKSYMKKVNDDSDVIIVTNKKPEENVVVLSKIDYDNLIENNYILNNQYLMEKIQRADKQFNAGKGIIRDLIEVDDD